MVHKMRGRVGVPNLHFVGDYRDLEGKWFHVMVMDLLGTSLDELLKKYTKFDLSSTLHTAVEMVSF